MKNFLLSFLSFLLIGIFTLNAAEIKEDTSWPDWILQQELKLNPQEFNIEILLTNLRAISGAYDENKNDMDRMLTCLELTSAQFSQKLTLELSRTRWSVSVDQMPHMRDLFKRTSFFAEKISRFFKEHHGQMNEQNLGRLKTLAQELSDKFGASPSKAAVKNMAHLKKYQTTLEAGWPKVPNAAERLQEITDFLIKIQNFNWENKSNLGML